MDIIKPFAKAVDYVLEMNFSAKPAWGKPAASETYPFAVAGEVVVRVGIIGALDGVMAVAMQEKTAVAIATKYGGARNVTRVNREVESLLREFINMASGNAIAHLAAGDVTCDITTPEIVTGRNMAIQCAPPVRTAALPFSLNEQNLVLYITLRRAIEGEPLAWRVF